MRLSRSGRPDGSVRLVAATKSVGLDQIREGITAGLTILGENRLQEALPKIEALRGAPIQWHFIGHLQRRKVRSVVGVFDLIQSVDSVELAEEIDRRAREAGLTQAVLLEVNLEGEATKAGFLPDELEGAMPRLGGLAPCGSEGAHGDSTSDQRSGDRLVPTSVVCVSWRCAFQAKRAVPFR